MFHFYMHFAINGYHSAFSIYAKIYNIKKPGIWGNIFDRIQGIENSKLSPSEVLFYILSGISFSKYEGFIKGTETEENQEGENDDNE